MDGVTSNSKHLKNKKISAIKNANSLQVLKKSGFFSKIYNPVLCHANWVDFDFFENKSNKTHFNIT